jgi:hypothetical protein
MSIAEPAKPKSKLRWYQFSLRSLLIFITLFACACSWFVVKMGQANRQREAAAAIRKLHGTVYYDYQLYGPDGCDLGDCMDIPKSPNLYSKQLGIDFFHSVDCILCQGQKINDSIIEPLRSLPNLKRLDLSDTSVSDSGLNNLEELLYLKYLILDGTPITDDGLRSLKSMKNLNLLDLSRTNISDDGMEHLVELINSNIYFLKIRIFPMQD